MYRMIVANLLYRPLRTLLTMVAVAVEVTLILLIVGLALGLLNDSKTRQQGIGADVLVQPPGSSFLVGVTGAPVPVKVADVIRSLPHVEAVAPVIWQLTTAGAVEIVYGIDFESYDRLIGGFRFLEGGTYQGPYDVIVDDVFAYGKGKGIGSEIEILNHGFRICGIVEHGRGARKFLQLATLQELIGAQGKASVFYVKTDTPADAELVAREIVSVPGLQQYVVRSMREYLSMMTPENIPGLSQFITVVIGVAVTIGFLVLLQAMYAAVLERTREIGILKSLGASQLYIVHLILRETLLVAAAGTMAGIVISFAARGAIRARFPTLPILIEPRWILYSIAIALTGALLGATYPAIKAARKDPIDALAYE
jgi:putative ABC transport system permease protein